jgi:tRNA(Ile)-lysidine synthetase-like protein
VPRLPATGRVDRALRSALRALAAGGRGPGAVMLVGVSGGQDSLCLVHALWRLQAEHGWTLHVATVDHGIRAEAAAETAHVARLAAAWGLPAHVLGADVPAYRRRERLNLQQAARYARYQLLARQAAAVGAMAVVVGHTADDVAETLLLHLLRGAGLDGLAAPPPRQTLPRAALGPPLDDQPVPAPLVVLRPLLGVARADTAAYCAEHALAPVGELPGHYQRDRLRAALLPSIERYAPAARRALVRAAEALAEERAALTQVVDAAWAAYARREGDAVVLSLAGWPALAAAVRKRLLRRALTELAGTVTGISQRSLAAALALAAGQAGRWVDWPQGLRLTREPGALRLAPRCAPAQPPAGPWTLPVPGRLVVPEAGIISAVCATSPPPRWPAATAPECWLDAAAVGGPLTVRWRRPGDRFQPLGMAEPKRLQDFFVDAGVPRAARAGLPLVVAERGIAWVVGQRIAHWARARPESRALTHLTFAPLETASGDGS